MRVIVSALVVPVIVTVLIKHKMLIKRPVKVRSHPVMISQGICEKVDAAGESS